MREALGTPWSSPLPVWVPLALLGYGLAAGNPALALLKCSLTRQVPDGPWCAGESGGASAVGSSTITTPTVP